MSEQTEGWAARSSQGRSVRLGSGPERTEPAQVERFWMLAHSSRRPTVRWNSIGSSRIVRRSSRAARTARRRPARVSASAGSTLQSVSSSRELGSRSSNGVARRLARAPRPRTAARTARPSRRRRARPTPSASSTSPCARRARCRPACRGRRWRSTLVTLPSASTSSSVHGDEVGAAQPDLAAGRQPEVLRRRLGHEVVVLDEQLARERHRSDAVVGVLRVVARCRRARPPARRRRRSASW